MRKRDKTVQLSPAAMLVKYIIIGVVAALVLCIIFSFAAALILSVADLPHRSITPISMAIIGISSFIGSFVSGKMLHKKGLVLGALIGVVLFAFIFIADFFIPGGSQNNLFLLKAILCLLPSIVGAVLSVNTRVKY